MKIRYYVETDTLYIEFRHGGVVETRDLDENTLLDIGDDGKICALTVEHASERTGIPEFSYEQVPARHRTRRFCGRSPRSLPAKYPGGEAGREHEDQA